jgi:hypothetical protein
LAQPATPEAVDQRYNPAAVKYIAASVEHGLKKALATPVPGGLAPAEQLRQHFQAVYLADSTAFDVPATLEALYPSCGGDGSAANVKVLLRYEALQGRLEPLRVLPGKRADQGLATQLAQQLHKDELQTHGAGFDPGAFSGSVIATLTGQEKAPSADEDLFSFFLFPLHCYSPNRSQPAIKIYAARLISLSVSACRAAESAVRMRRPFSLTCQR